MSTISNNLASQITAYNIITEDPALISHELNQQQLLGLAQDLIDSVEINSADISPQNAADALMLIGKLQSQGVDSPELNSTKAFLSTIVQSAKESSVKSVNPAEAKGVKQALEPQAKPVKKDDGVDKPDSVSQALMLSDIEQDASLAVSFAGSMLTSLLKPGPDMKSNFIENMRSFALESVKDTSAKAQLSGNSITNDEVLTDMTATFQTLLGALELEDLQTILINITQPDIHNIGLSLNDLIEKFYVRTPQDVEVSMSLNYVYSAFASLHDALKRELAKHHIDPQNALDLDRFTEDPAYLGVNQPFVNKVLDDITNDIYKEYKDDLRGTIIDIGVAPDLTAMVKILENFHGKNFKANLADPSEYQPQVRGYLIKDLQEVATQLPDKVLDQLLTKLNTPDITDQLKDIDQSFHDMSSVNKDELKQLITALKQEKAGRVIAKMDFSVTVLNRWEQFVENLSNWLNTIFNKGQGLMTDSALHQAEQFATTHGRELWQLTETGLKSEDLATLIKSQFKAKHPDIPERVLNRTAEKISEIFISSGHEWLENNYGSVKALPKSDIRVQLRDKTIVELGQIFSLDLTGLDSEECLTLRDGLLKEIQFQTLSSPTGELSADKAKDIVQNMLGESAKVLAADKKSLLIIEPGTLTSRNDQVHYLLSQLSRGISKPGMFLDVAAALASNFSAMYQEDYKTRKATDPHAQPLDQDQQRLARNAEFAKQLATLTDEQILHLAEMAESKDFRDLKVALILVNPDYNSGTSLGVLHYYRMKDTNTALTSLATAISDECEKRHLQEPAHDTSEPASMDEIPAKLQSAIYSFDDTMELHINRAFSRQVDSLIHMVGTDKIGGFIDPEHSGDFFDLAMNIYQCTGQNPKIGSEAKDFEKFFLPHLTDKLEAFSNEELVKFYTDLNSQAMKDMEDNIASAQFEKDTFQHEVLSIIKYLKETTVTLMTKRGLPHAAN